MKMVVLTGAGISAESGLKTFRDNGGLWENSRVEDVATPEAFTRDRALVYRFYNERRRQLIEKEIKPNPAHLALARLELALGDDFLLVTQNVDNLHERAGSIRIRHMHGELLSARCIKTGQRHFTEDAFDAASPCLCCQPPSGLRPDIVWFGEMPMYMDEIQAALKDTDVFVAIGTSGQVYPAAGFVDLAHQFGAHCVELNLEPSAGQSVFDETHYGLASDVVSQYVEESLARW